MKINEFAKLTGTTVRTLHYYDEIGLLKPSEVTEAGYRLYDDKALEVLQQILFFRELEFSLSEIKEIMKSPHYNKEEALIKQRELMIKKRSRMDELIQLLDHAIEGEQEMNFKAFETEEIDEMKKAYAKEVKTRWGKTEAYGQYKEKTAAHKSLDWKQIEHQCAAIFEAFSECRGMEPSCCEIQQLVRKWQDCITANFYHCTNEILKGLGQMYVYDERFKKNIDKYGAGTADLISKAIEIYTSNDKE